MPMGSHSIHECADLQMGWDAEDELASLWQ